MSRHDKSSQDSYNKLSSVAESMYPTREQFACVRCKNKKFTSWNDFENHHAKHAVDFTFSQLPIVKLQKIKINPLNSKNLTSVNHQDSETQSSSVIIDSIDSGDTAITTFSVVPAATNEIPTPYEPCENKLPEEEEELLTLTWPGSCESSSPLNSPIPLSTSSETTTLLNTATGDPQIDSNILDPAFIEKLGEEIRFLNQTTVDSVKDTIENDPKDSFFEIQSCDINKSGSSLSSISISDFPVSSLGDIPLAEPITPETPPAEKAIISDELDKSENQIPVINEKDVLNTIPDEAELPKSKGQLRLVPYESLLSPSFLHADLEEQGESNQSPVSPSKTFNKPQAMVAIPEQNLEDLNILVNTLTTSSAPVKLLTETVSTQVLQKSQPPPPPQMTTQNTPQPTQIALMPQQQRLTQVNQYQNLVGQLVLGSCQPQPYQQQQVIHQQQQQQTIHQQQQQNQFQQQQYLQQHHQVMNSLQYQQQIGAGQQQNMHAQGQAHQNLFSNQPRMQYPVQPYSASCRTIQPNQHVRAVMNSAMTFSNSNGTINVAPVSSSNYFQQSTNNSVQSMPSSTHIQHQLVGHSSYNHNHTTVHTNNSLPYYSNRPQTSTTQHVQLQIPLTQSNRPSVSTTQTNVRPQMIALPNQGLGLRLVPSPSSTTAAPVQQPIQQRQEFVAIRPHIQPTSSLCPPRGSLPMSSQVTPNSQIVGVNVPTTSTAVTISSVIRLPTSSHQGQTAANSLNRPVIHKRPLLVEGGISGVGQPAHKIPRTDETNTVISSNISATQKSGDCEVLLVQKKQTGLPVIQSVEGCSNLSTSKSSVQVLQTPSVASLLSNPNITVTPAKNKENQAGSDSASKAATTAGNNGVIGTTTRPVTIDLTRTSSSLLQQRNPLQCQVCNETFNSQSLLKIHLVLHLRKVHPTAVRPTNNPPVGKNHGSKHAVTSVSSNFSGQTTDTVTPSTSGYVSAVHSSTTNKHTPPAIIQPADINIGSVNASQQTKNGAKSGQSRLANEINVTPIITASSQAQPSSSKESSSNTTEKTASSEFYIPVVDLNKQDVITKLESMGITQFIPAANLTSCSNNKNFAIPIISSSALRRAGTTGFPSLCGVVNLGSPKTFSSTASK